MDDTTSKQTQRLLGLGNQTYSPELFFYCCSKRKYHILEKEQTLKSKLTIKRSKNIHGQTRIQITMEQCSFR